MNRLWKTFSVVAFLTSAIFSNPPDSEPNTNSPTAPLDHITLQLKWFHQFQFAGFYAAVEKGIYEEVGLKVSIKQGEPGMDFVEEVLSDRADYGIEMPELLIARNQGKPVVVLAALFQHSPQIFLARADSGIHTPHDLIGKKVMWRFDSAAGLRAMLLNEDVSTDQITFTELSWNINDLIEGRIDVIDAYVTTQPFALEQAGVDSAVISPINYGIDFYGDCLFTTEHELLVHPKRVAAFREASLRGWMYAMKHPEEIMALILETYNSNISLDFMRHEYQHMRQLMLPNLVEIGHMNPGRWKHIGDTFVQLDMLELDYSLDGFLYDYDSKVDPTKIMRLVWILAAIIGGFFICMVLLALYNRKLNQEVQARTKSLSEEVLERKRAENEIKRYAQRLAVHVENTPLGVIEWDLDFRITQWNRAAEKIFGYTKEETIGKFAVDLIVPDIVRNHVDSVWQELISHEGGTKSTNENVTKSGQTILCDWYNTTLVDDQGTIVGVASLVQDVSAKRQLEEKLRQAHKMEAIGTLAGGIAHDFNNILAGIIGYSEMAKDEMPKWSPSRDYLDQVLSAGNRAKDLVRQILTFSRKGPEQQHPIQPASIIKEGLKLIRASLPTTIEIIETIDPDCPSVLANPTHIHQTLVNLCTNALHAMQDQKGILAVSLSAVELSERDLLDQVDITPGIYVELKVSDSGIGMNEPTSKRIFEPYFTTKAVGKGSGMGLALVHGIVAGCGGFIRVESQPAEGSTFYLYFPASHDNSEELGPEEVTQLPQGGERILAVDDEPSIARLYKTALESLGYLVTTYTNSKEALEVFKSNPDQFDLILTDQTMPHLDGAELAKQILQIRPNLPIIMCTGFSSIISAEKAEEIGINRYLLKPVSKKDLAHAVRDVLDTVRGSS